MTRVLRRSCRRLGVVAASELIGYKPAMPHHSWDDIRHRTVENRIADFLREHPKVPYCDDCLQQELSLPRRQQARNATASFAAAGGFTRAKGTCSVCRSEKLVARAD